MLYVMKEFINKLGEDVRTLCTKALTRGIGSMEYIHSLMHSGEDEVGHESSSSQSEPQPEWCVCGNCQPMTQEIENKCCKHKKCVTESRRFQKLCLDPEVLELCIKNRSDIRNDPENHGTSAFRKAAYRQYILDKYGYLGKGNRKVAPSCVVLRIRKQYPSANSLYMGFRPW